MYNMLNEYEHKCNVLKQIQSNKAYMFRIVNIIQNFLTVVVSAFITFIGFSGMDNMQKYIEMVFPGSQIDQANIQMAYNLLVFVLFLVTIFHLVFHFNEKQGSAEKAIWLLSGLINDIHNMQENPYAAPTPENIESIENRYNVITQVIPSNTDREYTNAKKKLEEKALKNRQEITGNLILLTDGEKEKYIEKLIEKNKLIQAVLKILAEQEEKLYLGGGVIRNLVWDSLHGYKHMTPIEDVDIIYFDTINCTKVHDENIEAKLQKKIPNIKWSVKNQARMNEINGDEAYTSLEDAVSKWPETASAMVLRRENDGRYIFIAPFKFDDLFRLIVRPTPHFMAKLDKYKERIDSKKWGEKWKKLLFLYTD